MKITEDFIQRFATKESVKKGRLAYLKGAVTLKKSTETLVRAEVRDGKTFTVEFHARPGNIIDSSCNCPFDWEGECKHIIAVAYAIVQDQMGRRKFRKRKRVSSSFTPVLYLREMEGRLSLELRFDYKGFELHPIALPDARHKEGISSLVEGGQFIEILRDEESEEQVLSMLPLYSLKQVTNGNGSSHYVPTLHPVDWLNSVLPELQGQGFRFFGQEYIAGYRVRTVRPSFALRISSGIDWFELSGKLTFDEQSAEFADVVEALRKKEKFVRLSDGTFGVLPEKWIKKFEKALFISQKTEKVIRMPRQFAAIIDDLADEADTLEADDTFREMASRLRKFTSIAHIPLPDGFSGKLRQYQRAGYDWLHFLREFRFSGILADDMGLGKTVQTLVFLRWVYESKRTILPSLIVVPTSIVFNWMNEINKFTPGMKTFVYRGTDRRDHFDEFREYEVVITTYGVLRRDIEILKKVYFEYVILDESQNIKNYGSITARSARMLRSDFRLALSGTPVENNLMELWSQFAFLNPGMLGTNRMFLENFARPVERDGDERVEKTLKKMIYPFVLRRTKETVATDLPPKIETVSYCEMTAHQHAMYQKWKGYYRRSIIEKIEEQGLKKSKLLVLEGLMRLRQICCHPSLVDEKYTGGSGKYEMYLEMLHDLLAEGHKVLVFSQFVKMLKILRRYLETHKIPFEYLDGHTHDREERVERFQNNDQVRIFLISLKAGGLGLNLTAADYVIHYDPWWNPAVEMQATDRTHRIGQKKPVFSYKLITKNSIEEKIVNLQDKKRELVENIVSTDLELFKKLTRADVETLFE